ncbi:hypothetical protein II898_09340 [bacterium]|nr:hypothetical protein [bacterium]
MKKFLNVAFVTIAAMILVSCSGKNLDDLIDVPDTGDSADSSATSEQNDTDNGGDTNADTADSNADTGDSNTDTADSTADTGDSTTDTGDSTADTGDSTTDTGDSTADTGDSTADTGDSGNENDADSDSDDVEVSDVDMSDNDQEESGDDADSSDSDSDNDKDPADSGDDNDPSDSGDDSDTTDSGDDNDTDSGENQQKCTEITLDHPDKLSYKKESSRSYIFKTTYTQNTGSATSDTFYLRFYGDTYTYSGNHPLVGTNWYDDYGYSSSGVFVYVYEDEYCDSYSGICSHNKMYFQRKGYVNVSLIQVDSGTEILYADLDGVELEEVTINGANQSIPKEGGECLKIKDTEVHYQCY